MNVRPGYGAPELHLKMDLDDVKRSFGPPEKRQKGDGFRIYYLYPKLGFDCIVSQRSGKVLSLFFHRPLDSQFDVRTDTGIAIGDDRAKVAAVYPKPDGSSEGFELSTGTFVGPWLSFDEGIAFHLDRKDKVETISIFAPVRRNAPSVADTRVASETVHELRRAG